MNGTHAIHLLSRAVLIQDDHILLTIALGARSYMFLPGGHIEHGEPAPAALRRELQEELGVTAEIGDFLGCLEATWDDKGNLFHELNLLFATTAPNLQVEVTPESQEEHIRFCWWPLADLSQAPLLPDSLKSLIPRWHLKRQAKEAFASDWLQT